MRNNHDILMARVARRIYDPKVLRLIRRFLRAGLMADGIETVRSQGTPQGGPLSPLLSNILLTDLDRELERRGLSFSRYADDCNIYVRSQRAGERIMVSISAFLATRLKLSIESRGQSLAATIEQFNPLLRGWMNYFQLTQSRRPLEALDAWVRRRLRSLVWRQWKKPKTRASRLRARGLDPTRAWKSSVNGRGPWWNAGAKHMIAALPPQYFAKLGLVSLVLTHQQLQRST